MPFLTTNFFRLKRKSLHSRAIGSHASSQSVEECVFFFHWGECVAQSLNNNISRKGTAFTSDDGVVIIVIIIIAKVGPDLFL